MRKTMTLAAIVMAAVLVAAAAQAGNPNAGPAAGDLYIALVGPGEFTCIGGEPTGNPMLPCTPGTQHVVWRNYVGAVITDNVTGPGAPYIPGSFMTSGNCNLDGAYAGPCWGTFEAPWLGGTWAGSWNGRLDFGAYGGVLAMVGHGTGGDIDGMQLKIEAEGEPVGDQTAPMAFVARVQKIND